MNPAKDKACKLMMQAIKIAKKGDEDAAVQLLLETIEVLVEEVDRLEALNNS